MGQLSLSKTYKTKRDHESKEKIMKKLIMIALGMLLGSIEAYALGADTNYGTDITNQATLNYEVGGNAQTAEVSNTDTFKVDRKVDVAVATTDGANVVVEPGDNVGNGNDNAPLTFTVTNETNGNQDFILSASNLVTGTASLDAGQTDNIDFATDLKICTDATCSGGDISGTNQSFTEDETKTYYVFADIPLGTADGSIASIALTATAVDDGTTNVMTDDSATADDPTAVQIVFADDSGDASGDGQYDGKHSALSAYEVATATIAVTKTSCVVWDPVNGAAPANNPKRIPGAVIRYAINVNNTGSADASNTILTDGLSTDLTYGTTAPAPTAVAEIRDAACDCLAPAGNVIAGDTVSASGQNVTANYNTVSSNSQECAYFDVTIN